MLSKDQVNVLESLGYSHWTRSGHNRLYIDAKKIGLDARIGKSGLIKEAAFNGESIDIHTAAAILNGKYYIDMEDESIHTVIHGGSKLAGEIASYIENRIEDDLNAVRDPEKSFMGAFLDDGIRGNSLVR